MRLSHALPTALLFAGSFAAGSAAEVIVLSPDMFPAAITNPGAYRLAGNTQVTNPAAHGIAVQCNNVAIDLGGFALSGPGDGTGNGIHQPAGFGGLSISNGIVRNWKGAPGLDSNESGVGILAMGTRTVVRSLTVTECARGVRLGPESSVFDTTAYSNRLHGVYVARGGLLNACTAYATGTGFECGEDTAMERCTSYGNEEAGFRVEKGADLSGCTANGNRTGFECGSDCDMVSAAANGNTRDGIVMDRACVARECSANENGRHGITMGASCESDRNSAHGNADRGILATGSDNRITGCKTMGNRAGIAALGSGNTIQGNVSGANRDANFSIAAGNTLAHVFADEDPDATSNEEANIDLDLAPAAAK